MAEKTTIKPEIQVFIKALRRGKSDIEALTEYCWAKSVVPILRSEYERGFDPMWCSINTMLFCSMMAYEARHSDDATIADAFERGLEDDRRSTIWRSMGKDERPSFGQLVRAMNLDEQLEASKFFGLKNVALAIVGSD